MIINKSNEVSRENSGLIHFHDNYFIWTWHSSRIFNYFYQMKLKFKLGRVLLIMILLMPFYSFPQQGATTRKPGKQFHHEVIDQPYMAPASGQHTNSLRIKSAGFTMVQVNVDAYGQNIPGDAANEPSMTIDPQDPRHIVIGWRQFDNVYSNFRQSGYGYSTDGGQTWTFPGSINPGVFGSDPVLDCDTSGNFYYNGLTVAGGSYLCHVFKSENGGSAWSAGVEAHGGDKQWMIIDRSGGTGTGNVYSDWNEYFSSCPPGAFIRSTDDGASFGDCSELPGNPYWGTMAIGNDGEVYITGWSDVYGIIVLKSTSAQHADSIPDWNLSVPDLDGQPAYGELVNPQGLAGQFNISIDRSGGSAHGNVYLLSTVLRFSNSDSADVMFTRSTDGGMTWNPPVKVNDDQGSGSYHWFGTMSVAPNGRIDATWLDTRDSPPGSLLSALYYSYSIDQGTSWSANQKLSVLFDSRIGWPQQAKMGDYVSMISDNEKACLAWANTLNYEEDVYFTTITPFATGIADKQAENSGIHISSYPCPFNDHTTINYDLPEGNFVSLSLMDICGREIKSIVSGYQCKGNHQINLSGTGIPRGYYFIKIVSGMNSSTIGTARID